jgi:hypothetical protein
MSLHDENMSSIVIATKIEEIEEILLIAIVANYLNQK